MLAMQERARGAMRGWFQFCSRYMEAQHMKFGLTASNVKNWAVFVLGRLRVPKFMKACKVLAPRPLPSPKTHSFPLFHTKKISWRSSLKDYVLTHLHSARHFRCLTGCPKEWHFRVTDLHWNSPPVTTASTKGTTTLLGSHTWNTRTGP